MNVVNDLIYIYIGFTFTTKLSYREGTSTFAANQCGQRFDIYIYMGFTFTTKLSYREGTSAFAAKGKKAVFHLCKALTRLKDLTRQT